MRKLAVAAVAAIGALGLATVAEAHVSLHPNTLPAGSFPTINIRVPNEETSADVTKVDVQFPPGFLDVSTGYLPGWTAKVMKRKLATPVKTDTGTVTEEVSEVIWTGGKIPVGDFLEFPIATSPPDDAAGKTLTFKALETYSGGKVVRWIGPPDAKEPAPTVNVTPKGGVVEDVAGTEAGPGTVPSTAAPAQPKAKATASKGASKGLGIAALVVGILGLLAALVALGLARSRRGAVT